MKVRYRVWLKNGKYEIVVARNRYEALAIAITEKRVKEGSVKAVGKATQRGRLFFAPF